MRSISHPQAPIGRHRRGKHQGMLSTPCLSFPSCIREMPSLWLSLVTRLQKSLGEGTMSFIPAHGEHQAPHDAQSACGLIPQQHRGQGCHTTSETRAQDDTRASFVLEPVQGHKLFVELDISHTITYETGVRPSAYPAMSPQGQSRVGTHLGAHTHLGNPLQSHNTARLSSGQISTGTCRKPLSPGGSHCELEVPGWHCLARAADMSTLSLCPPGHGVIPWPGVQLLTKHKPSQRGFQVP